MLSENMPLLYEPKHLITEKTAARYRKLSNNSAEWGRQIHDALYNEQQQLNTRKVQIQWESKDDTTGNAVGRATVDGKIAIPIIIHNFKMAPLDTFTDARVKPHRMNPKRLKQALFNPDLFSGIVTPQDERGLMPDVPLYRSYGVLPWEEGRRVYAADKLMGKIPIADFEKCAQEDPGSVIILCHRLATNPHAWSGDSDFSLLDQILKTATLQDLKKFASILEANPQLAVNFYAHGHADIISKILNTRPSTYEKVADDMMERLPASVVQLRFTPDHQLLMKVSSDGIFAPQEVVLPRQRFESTLASLGIEDTGRALKKAASVQGLLVTLRPKNAEPVFTADLKPVEAISKFGHYVVKDHEGHEHRGAIFPQFFGLTKAAMPRSLFISEGMSVMQPKIAGILDTEGPEELTSHVPTVGDTGCFVYEKDAQNALALEPVTIQVIEHQHGQVQLSAVTLMGEKVAFHISKNVRDLVTLPSEGDPTYLVPATMKFVRLDNLKAAEVLVADAPMLNKIATAEVLGPNSCRVSSPVGGRLFLFQGPAAEKMGCAGIEQYPDEAVFKLACMGLSAEDATMVIDRAQAQRSVVVGGLRTIRPAEDFVGHEKRAANMQLLASLPQVQQDTELMTKIAGDVQDPTSVDRILALGVLNPQNISVLVDHMGDLENTGVRLSEMLLASRIGAKDDLNESAIIQARQAIDDVLDGLSNLKSRLGPQTATHETGGSAE